MTVAPARNGPNERGSGQAGFSLNTGVSDIRSLMADIFAAFSPLSSGPHRRTAAVL